MITLEKLAPYLPYGVQMKCTAIFRPNQPERPKIKGADATMTPDLLADISNGTYTWYFLITIKIVNFDL